MCMWKGKQLWKQLRFLKCLNIKIQNFYITFQLAVVGVSVFPHHDVFCTIQGLGERRGQEHFLKDDFTVLSRILL